MNEKSASSEYSVQRRWHMNRAQVRKQKKTGSYLATTGMKDVDLWHAAEHRIRTLEQILSDGADLRAYQAAQDLDAILLELRARGIQLALFDETIRFS